MSDIQYWETREGRAFYAHIDDNLKRIADALEKLHDPLKVIAAEATRQSELLAVEIIGTPKED